MKKTISKIINIRVFIYAFFIWLNLNISGIQNSFFSDGEILTVILVKILHLFFLYAILLKIHSLYMQRDIPKVKNEIIISLIYMIILTILIVLVWPGTWSSDDISVLKNTESYTFTPWQHFFSGLFQILCLQTIPIPTGVIIVQSVIASLIVGYCISNISTIYARTRKQETILQIILGLIFLLPPLLLYIMSGFRMGLYSYLEIALITKLIIIYKEQKKITIKELLKISFLTIIISCWRTEGIYYPICILILYFILGKKVIRRKVAIITFTIVMITNISIGKINNYMIGTNDHEHHPTMKANSYNNPIMKSNNYSITATMEPITQLVKISDESDKEEIEKINKVVDVEYILENPLNSGERNFWTEEVVKDYSDEEYKEYLKAYLKLAIKYPKTTFESMWNIFVKSGSGLGENGKQVTRNMVSGEGTLDIYEVSSYSYNKWTAITSNVMKYKQAINLELRNNVINFLNGTNANGEVTLIHNFAWNLFIPFILVGICLIYKLIKKDWFMVFIILTIIARIPLVFATAPAPYFMYYLSTCLCSYVISAIIIFEFIINNEKIKKKIKIEIFLPTFLVWFVLNALGIQKIFFTEYHNFLTVVIKLLHFIFLYIIFYEIGILYEQRHIPKVKKQILISIIYFLILMVFMMLVWPGIWNCENITILNNAQKYKITKYHFFSSIFQMLCLQTIPLPTGVIIIQALISSLIVGYCITNIPEILGKDKKQKEIILSLLLLICLFPRILVYILSGAGIGISDYMDTLNIYTVNTNVWVKWNAVTSRVMDFKNPINFDVRNSVILFFNNNINIIWCICACIVIITFMIKQKIRKD